MRKGKATSSQQAAEPYYSGALLLRQKTLGPVRVVSRISSCPKDT
jgi:hypothetical protein